MLPEGGKVCFADFVAERRLRGGKTWNVFGFLKSFPIDKVRILYYNNLVQRESGVNPERARRRERHKVLLGFLKAFSVLKRIGRIFPPQETKRHWTSRPRRPFYPTQAERPYTKSVVSASAYTNRDNKKYFLRRKKQ